MTLAAMTLTLGDYAALAGIVGVPLGVLVVMMQSVRGSVERLTDRISMMERRSDERFTMIESRVAEVEQNKVNREDWIREDIRTRTRVDHVAGIVRETAGKIDATNSLVSAVHQLARSVTDAIEGKAA